MNSGQSKSVPHLTRPTLKIPRLQNSIHKFPQFPHFEMLVKLCQVLFFFIPGSLVNLALREQQVSSFFSLSLSLFLSLWLLARLMRYFCSLEILHLLDFSQSFIHTAPNRHPTPNFPFHRQAIYISPRGTTSKLTHLSIYPTRWVSI